MEGLKEMCSIKKCQIIDIIVHQCKFVLLPKHDKIFRYSLFLVVTVWFPMANNLGHMFITTAVSNP